MAGILSHLDKRLLPGGGYRGPEPPAARGGGGGGGRGDGDDVPSFHERLQRYRMGMKLTAASIVVLFLSFTSLFLARRDSGRIDPVTGVFRTDWRHIELPLRMVLINTMILAASCLLVELARRAVRAECILVPLTRIPGVKTVRQHSLGWTAAAALLGTAFLAGQFLTCLHMRHTGALPNTGPASMFVYVMAGAHALHLLAGLAVLLYACTAVGLRVSLYRRSLTLDVTAWYWHFMSLMWVYVVVVLKLMA